MKNCYFFLIFVFFSFLFFGLILAQELPRVSFPVAELGNCGSRAECAAYCDDIAHIEECLTFAERYGLIPPDELEEGKKVATAIKQGITPPNCRNKTECDVYCMVPENMEECLTFAEAAGLIPPEELENAKMALEAIKKGVKPPPLSGES